MIYLYCKHIFCYPVKTILGKIDISAVKCTHGKLLRWVHKVVCRGSSRNCRPMWAETA